VLVFIDFGWESDALRGAGLLRGNPSKIPLDLGAPRSQTLGKLLRQSEKLSVIF